MQPGAKSFAISYFDQLDLTQGFSKKPSGISTLFGTCDKVLELSNEFLREPTHFVHRERKIRLLSCSLVRVVRGRSRICFNILKVCGVKIDDTSTPLKKILQMYRITSKSCGISWLKLIFSSSVQIKKKNQPKNVKNVSHFLTQ